MMKQAVIYETTTEQATLVFRTDFLKMYTAEKRGRRRTKT
jgi:hypothetical protein